MSSLLLLFLLGGAGLALGAAGGSASGGSDPDPDGDSDPGPGDGSPDVPDLPGGAYDIGWAGLSDEEQYVVELVNRARLDPLGEVALQSEGLAAGVSSSPVEALAVIASLSDAAEGHSEDMDDRDFFAHVNPDGESPGDRAVAAGYDTPFVGENIGWIGSVHAPEAQSRADGHHANLWESDGHQQNLMHAGWSEIGLGYDYGDLDGYDGSTFVTQLFGDRGESYLTGVVIEDADGDDFYDIGEGQGDVRITAWDGETAHATATWEAGGYALALPPGTYTVVFEGGDLDQPYETEVTIGGENVKLDVIDEGGTVAATLSAGPALDLDALMVEASGQEDMLPPDEVVEDEDALEFA